MTQFIDSNICFECGNKATEQHHIIPRVYGGKRTIPLCSSCHMKVHGVSSEKRIDNHKENVIRGLDKRRVWELFSVWYLTINKNFVTRSDFRVYYENFYNGRFFSVNKINKIMDRLNEIESDYLFHLFDNNINQEFSVIWNWKKPVITHNLDTKIKLEVSKNLKRIKENEPRKGKFLSNEARQKSIQKRKDNAKNNTENKKATQLIVENYDRGKSFYEITKTLNDLGMKTSRRNEFSQVQVKRLYVKNKKK